MMQDAELIFSDNQAVTSLGSNASTNVVDLGVDRDIGAGNTIYAVASCTSEVTSGGAATVTFQIETDNDEGFGSPEVIGQSGPVAVADMPAGAQPLKMAVPHYSKRYLRLNYEVGTAALTGGTFTSSIVLDVDAGRLYPAGAEVF